MSCFYMPVQWVASCYSGQPVKKKRAILREAALRGLLLRLLVRAARVPPAAAAAASALSFGLAHRSGGRAAVAQHTRSGLGLAAACLATRGGVRAPVLAHVVWNVLVNARRLPAVLNAVGNDGAGKGAALTR